MQNMLKLKDTENKTGFWFVLQDLSVRTEGTFRYVFFLLLALLMPVASACSTRRQPSFPWLKTSFADMH